MEDPLRPNSPQNKVNSLCHKSFKLTNISGSQLFWLFLHHNLHNWTGAENNLKWTDSARGKLLQKWSKSSWSTCGWGQPCFIHSQVGSMTNWVEFSFPSSGAVSVVKVLRVIRVLRPLRSDLCCLYQNASHVSIFQSNQQSSWPEARGAVHGCLREEHWEHLGGRHPPPLHVRRHWSPAVQGKVWTVHRSKPAGEDTKTLIMYQDSMFRSTWSCWKVCFYSSVLQLLISFLQSKKLCQGMFLLEDNTTTVEQTWQSDSFNFDNVAEAMLTLFVTSTFEGWPG